MTLVGIVIAPPSQMYRKAFLGKLLYVSGVLGLNAVLPVVRSFREYADVVEPNVTGIA